MCAPLQALRKVPGVNSSWMGDFIRQYHNVDISVAVQTPQGLMVPVLQDADGKGLSDISAGVKALAGKVGPAPLGCLGRPWVSLWGLYRPLACMAGRQ